jgi:hypothetical protein
VVSQCTVMLRSKSTQSRLQRDTRIYICDPMPVSSVGGIASTQQMRCYDDQVYFAFNKGPAK